MWGGQLPSGTWVPLATQLQSPQRCGSKGPPKLTGTLMAIAGELTEKQVSAFRDETTCLERCLDLKINMPINTVTLSEYTDFWTIQQLHQ